MKQAGGQYIVSFQTERFRQEKRHHWMICRAHKPDQLVSWGHAPTQELAEEAAHNKLRNLCSGLTQGGRVTNKSAHPMPLQAKP